MLSFNAAIKPFNSARTYIQRNIRRKGCDKGGVSIISTMCVSSVSIYQQYGHAYPYTIRRK